VRGRVLVAEASSDGREAVSRIFQAEGFSVITTTDGSEVIALAKEHRPDVVFLDVGLKRVNAGEVVRVLERFADTRSVVVVLTCPRDIDAHRLARLEATGALLVMVKPLTREGLLQAFRQALAESHERKAKFEPAAKRKPAATRHVSGNSSLLVRGLLCPFHETPVPVDHFVLRTGKIQTDTSFYDLPVYRSAVAGADYIDYHRLGVAVCPRCLFASNNPAYFADPAERKGASHEHTAAARAAVAAATGARIQMAGELPREFFTEERSLEGAIKSYELAIHAATTLLESNRHAMSVELLRLGNYHLRLAYLHEVACAGNDVRAAHFTAAYDWLREAFTVLAGAELFKTIYQLVALAISFGNDRAAYQYVSRLSELERDPTVAPEDRAALDRYLARCRRAWEDRGEHRFPWINAADGQSAAMASAA
jgi:two-component system cell cycle response regulator DivK